MNKANTYKIKLNSKYLLKDPVNYISHQNTEQNVGQKTLQW